MRKLLLFNCPVVLTNICKSLNIEYLEVDKNYQNNTIKAILSSDNLRSNQVLNYQESLMIFNEFNDDDLNNILSILKTENIKIDLKCIVTEHNINWKIIKLYDELLKEKKAMQKYA